MGTLGLFNCRRAHLDLETVVSSRGTRHYMSVGVEGGLVCWHLLPSSLSPVTVQPRDPSLLRH